MLVDSAAAVFCVWKVWWRGSRLRVDSAAVFCVEELMRLTPDFLTCSGYVQTETRGLQRVGTGVGVGFGLSTRNDAVAKPSAGVWKLTR